MIQHQIERIRGHLELLESVMAEQGFIAEPMSKDEQVDPEHFLEDSLTILEKRAANLKTQLIKWTRK